jgi:hypothetical protein
MHVAEVMRGVPSAKRCSCATEERQPARWFGLRRRKG